MTEELTPDMCNVKLSKAEFDQLCRENKFEVGPLAEGPSKEYGAPYVAPSVFRIFGQLKDGRKVWAQRYPES